MYSKVKILGHPIHPMLNLFPMAFYTASFVCFAIYQFGAHWLFWFNLGYIANLVALATALIAAIPGVIDFAVGIPKGTDAKRRGWIHGTLNLIALVLFAISAYLWRSGPIPEDPSIISAVLLTGAGFLFTVAGAYQGWDLVARNKVGVELTPEQERLQVQQEQRASTSRINNNPRTI